MVCEQVLGFLLILSNWRKYMHTHTHTHTHTPTHTHTHPHTHTHTHTHPHTPTHTPTHPHTHTHTEQIINQNRIFVAVNMTTCFEGFKYFVKKLKFELIAGAF